MQLHDDTAKIEATDAWAEYLNGTKDLLPHDYRTLEPWYWAKLQARLGNLKPKRSRAAA